MPIGVKMVTITICVMEVQRPSRISPPRTDGGEEKMDRIHRNK
jgi:hypothetical protein